MAQPTTYDVLREEHAYLQTVYTGLLREHRIQRDGTLSPELPEGRLLEGKETAPNYVWLLGNALDKIGTHLTVFQATGRAASLVEAVRDSFLFRSLPGSIHACVRMDRPSQAMVDLFRGAVAQDKLEKLLAQNN